jgi:hypothetical protein
VRDTIPLLLIAPIAGLVVDAIVHIVLIRLVHGSAHLRTQFLSFGCGALVTAGILAYLVSGSPLNSLDRVCYFILHLLIYICLGFCFFNVINANVSSLRLRMIKEYLRNEPVPVSDAAMYHLYPAEELVTARLVRLVSGGQIVQAKGRYFFRPSAVVFIGRCFSALRRLLMSSRPPLKADGQDSDRVGKMRQR